MKSFVALTAGIAMTSAVLGGPLPDPIAPAATGKLQCYEPDRAHKTCNSLAGYIKQTGWHDR